MRTLAIVSFVILFGCAPPPASKTAHQQQVKLAIAKAGGETNVQTDSRKLFARLTGETNFVLSPVTQTRFLEGLSSLTNLGDVLRYEPTEPDRVLLRVHNSHFDTYFIALVNPDLPHPHGFECIAGNVGFIEPGTTTDSR